MGCSGRARLVFGSMMVVSSMKLFPLALTRRTTIAPPVPDRVGQVMEYASANSIAAKVVTATANTG
eukprot:SAG22_NODE_403_length_11012_cov_12.141024_12_plen_66_part_00